METAINKWKNVYTEVLMNAETKPYNLDVAVSYGIQDMLNLVKNSSTEQAIFMINDDADYMQEKLDKRAK